MKIEIETEALDNMELRGLAVFVAGRARICAASGYGGAADELTRAAEVLDGELARRGVARRTIAVRPTPTEDKLGRNSTGKCKSPSKTGDPENRSSP